MLGHLPGREAALDRMAALRPGGWLLLEEFDSLSLPADPAVNPAERRLRLREAMYRVMAARGVDLLPGRLLPGRLLPGRLRARGLTDVGAEGRVLLWQGGAGGAALLRANFEQLRRPITAAEGLTADEFDRELALLDDPDVLTPAPIMWAVRERDAAGACPCGAPRAPLSLAGSHPLRPLARGHSTPVDRWHAVDGP